MSHLTHHPLMMVTFNNMTMGSPRISPPPPTQPTYNFAMPQRFGLGCGVPSVDLLGVTSLGLSS